MSTTSSYGLRLFLLGLVYICHVNCDFVVDSVPVSRHGNAWRLTALLLLLLLRLLSVRPFSQMHGVALILGTRRALRRIALIDMLRLVPLNLVLRLGFKHKFIV